MNSTYFVTVKVPFEEKVVEVNAKSPQQAMIECLMPDNPGDDECMWHEFPVDEIQSVSVE